MEFMPDADGKGGYVLYAHNSALMARWLNLETGEFPRVAVVVAERVIDDKQQSPLCLLCL
jgi:hypothetical protein